MSYEISHVHISPSPSTIACLPPALRAAMTSNAVTRRIRAGPCPIRCMLATAASAPELALVVQAMAASQQFMQHVFFFTTCGYH
jgi:hypothetical protein